jgi:hypothetical protein
MPWIIAGLIFAAITGLVNDAPRSPFWWSEYLLYGLMLYGLLQSGLRVPVQKTLAGLAYVAMVLISGAVYEASLTVDGSGIGGMHPKTGMSFLMAFGDYLLLALAALWLIRRFGLDFQAVFFLAAGFSLSEGLIFTGVLAGVVASPLWLMAPLMLAYYTLAYASFIALPLLVLPVDALTSGPVRLRRPMIWALGFGVSCTTRLVWGLIYIPAVEWLAGL